MDEDRAFRLASGDQHDALVALRKARLARESAEIDWHRKIADARDAGCSLRQIGAVAGVTNPRIHQILAEGDAEP